MPLSRSILLATLLAAVCLADARAAERSLLVGRWAVDTTRLPMPPVARPKSVTLTFADTIDGKWSTTVDIVDADGGKRHVTGANALDGTPAVVINDLESDIAAATMPTPGTLILQLGKNGAPGSTRVYTVSADGSSMIETSASFGDGGRPVLRTHYFTRMR